MNTPTTILETAPAFVAQTTQGRLEFPGDYKGKWVILFSHPADSTPDCATEFMNFATMMPEFIALNCELVGLSIDGDDAHIAWLQSIQDEIKLKNMEHEKVSFPRVADVKMDVAKAYGMVQPGASDPETVRAVFLIDPTAIIRAVLYYPVSNGRNFPEIKHLLLALQITDAHGCVTPTNWRPGDDVVAMSDESSGTAGNRIPQPLRPASVSG